MQINKASINRSILFIESLVLILFCLLFTGGVFAQEKEIIPVENTIKVEMPEIVKNPIIVPEEPKTLFDYADLFFKALKESPYLIGLLAVAMILSGGIKMIISGGDKEKSGSAIKTIFNAIWGTILLVLFIVFALQFLKDKF